MCTWYMAKSIRYLKRTEINNSPIVPVLSITASATVRILMDEGI